MVNTLTYDSRDAGMKEIYIDFHRLCHTSSFQNSNLRETHFLRISHPVWSMKDCTRAALHHRHAHPRKMLRQQACTNEPLRAKQCAGCFMGFASSNPQSNAVMRLLLALFLSYSSASLSRLPKVAQQVSNRAGMLSLVFPCFASNFKPFQMQVQASTFHQNIANWKSTWKIEKEKEYRPS